MRLPVASKSGVCRSRAKTNPNGRAPKIRNGHTGLDQARLLSDLNEIEEGDVFCIYVLGACLKYQVFDENYTDKTQGAQGFVAIPLSYFGFNNKIASLEDEERVYQVKNLIKSYISLKVTAVPLTTNFEAGDDTLMSVRDLNDIHVNIIQ